MDEQLRAFLGTIYGEAAQASPATWKAIASVIMNRVGKREWRKLTTPLRVIACSGFDAFTRQNAPFHVAYTYFGNDPQVAPWSPLERLRTSVLPIYEKREPVTTDAQLYYSPKALAELHRRSPQIWPARPRWHFDLLEPAIIPGTETDDFIFFRYLNTVAV
ncbi:MAG: hypothetical protein ABIY63_13255 [Fibrobacteria bacterium]